MLGAQNLLGDRQGTKMEGFGLAVGTLGFILRRQIVQGGGGSGMLGAQSLLVNRQSAHVQRFSLAVGTLGGIQPSEVI